MQGKLHRSKKDKKLCGVCGGLGEYFNVDPTIVRLIVCVLCLTAGCGLLLYIIAAIVIPEETPQDNVVYHEKAKVQEDMGEQASEEEQEYK